MKARFILILFSLGSMCIKGKAQLSYSQLDSTVSSLTQTILNNIHADRRKSAVDSLNLLLRTNLTNVLSFKRDLHSAQGISVLYPADSSFRLITGQYFVSDDEYRYYGGIQDSSGKYTELKDNSYEIRSDGDQYGELTAANWYGGLYYNLFSCTYQKQKYYLLLGFNGYSFYNKQKIIDVLHFDEHGQATFGKNVFLPDTGEVDHGDLRILYTYSADASVKLNYDPGLGFIVLDHLMAMKEIYPGQGPTAVPDGSLEGYKYNAGLWQHINVLDQVPLENIEVMPILDKRKGKDIQGKDIKKKLK